MSKKIFFVGLFILFSFFGNAQNKVWLIDGTVLKTNKCKLGEDGYIECYTEKGKLRYTDTADVFAIIVRETDTTFFYENNEYPLEKAKYFMQGQIDGKNYNNYYIYTGGLILGAATPTLLAYTPVYVFLAPVFSAGYIASFSGVNENSKFCDIPEEYKDNEDYIKGYKFSATRKKVRNTAIFSTVGLAIGYGLLFIIQP
ncbi:MAG: hypothetical protein JXL97_14145 [Bacteroidales bacterium]|nr:hypothetical protein [Bacteroidales bacterium]